MMAATQVLVDALATLKNPDGTLQEGNRKLALSSLISELTESETIDIRLRLNALRKLGFPEKLPAELHHKILDYISLEDSMNMRLVRRDWCDTFSSVPICTEIVKRHFPEKHELYTEEIKSLKDVDERKLAADKDLKEWLADVVKHRLRRGRGQYQSTSVYYYSAKRATGQWNSPQYCNGRIAYLTLDRMLIVKNICGEVTGCLALPQREAIGRWVLSDKYIVVVSTNQRTVYAWQLDKPLSESNDPHQQQLPNAITELTARDNRVGIVLRNWEIYIWEIGRPKNPLSAVPVPSIKPNLDMASSRKIVLFHPYKRGELVRSQNMTSSDSNYGTRTCNMLRWDRPVHLKTF